MKGPIGAGVASRMIDVVVPGGGARIGSRAVDRLRTRTKTGADVDRWLPPLFALAGAAVAWVVMGLAVTPLALGMLASYPLYRRTFARHMPSPARVVPLYLGAVAWQLLHFTEELTHDFHVRYPTLIGSPPWSDARFVGFNLAFYALFLVSAVAIWRRVAGPTCFGCFFIVAMLLNGVGHVGLSIAAGGYFPGLATAPVGFAIGVVLLRRLLHEPTTPDQRSR